MTIHETPEGGSFCGGTGKNIPIIILSNPECNPEYLVAPRVAQLRLTHSPRGVYNMGSFTPGFLRPGELCRTMPEHIKKKLEQEIRALEHELAHELPKEIKKAAALGDLSENAEYHMAKQRQEFVNARLGQLKKRMGELALVNLANIPKDRVAFGSRVPVFDTTKQPEIESKLVTSEESDVSK